MRNIAEKTNYLNTDNFLNNAKQQGYITGMNINVALTKDNKILAYTLPANNSEVITNTIENSTYNQLNNYETILLEDLLKDVVNRDITKDIYINIAPFKTGPLTDENIKTVTDRMNLYVDNLKKIVDKYPTLKINLHSINRSMITKMKNIIKNRRIGVVLYDRDLNYIDVDYYIIIMNNFDDSIIDVLVKQKKEVLLYLHSDCFISYAYEHYLGEKSTAYLQQVFKQIGLISSYPEIINRVFN